MHLSYDDAPLEIGMYVLRVMVMMAIVVVLGPPAKATRMALDPLNRVHAGLSMAGPTSMGLMAGMDSRLS